MTITKLYASQHSWSMVCGHHQSPIHIQSSKSLPMDDDGTITRHDLITISNILRDENTLFIEAKSFTQINGRGFHLTQFHFHSPAEHLIDNHLAPMELHFVHQSQSGRFAVFSIFIEVGAHNTAFQQLLDIIDSDLSCLPIMDFHAQKLFPKNISYYHYLGSLTTPPLTENVEWYVFQHPIFIDKAQLNHFRAMYHHTARETQPRHNRPVLFCQHPKESY
ncbi:carbonic anhydrase family protein [Entomospira entomophila]|uniref:carbonic anhydrase n=1 Tax=Entomospira entomophila TaxID=2719988 RepID=A0A968KT28_9SPIO|nr:carbonic anhydrase family protein [Entomospira entomophilus]NIZ40997.1 carbonic anhydrase family protein [Entomospira entomophilus]WDI35210.1 carbonic anhydrase family protein [Entomospira entomophilus]